MPVTMPANQHETPLSDDGQDLASAAIARPQLRAVEAFPHEDSGKTMFVLRDPAGLADQDLLLSPNAYLIAALLDGTRDLDAIRTEFFKRTGQVLPADQLDEITGGLRRARFLEGPEFEAYYGKLASAYRIGTERRSGDLLGAGVGEDESLADMFARMFPGQIEPVSGEARVRGLIAPHLDYKRGWECYARAYARLRGECDIGRFVILGTNHFGRSGSVVATDKTFVTPLGRTEVDRPFLANLSARCGTDLCAGEYDHLREHSVELQVLILQSLFGPDAFEVVPFLCPDPCGPTGTDPLDGRGIDLRRFAEHLRDTLVEDRVRTVVIAAADLSHVGRRFGDDTELDAMFLHDVSARDQRALIAVRENNPEKFRRTVAENDNPTRICSAGCIYTLLVALPDAAPSLLRYDQANTPDQHACVTCSAFVLTDKPVRTSSIVL